MKPPPGLPWSVWRLVMERVASLQEVETHYSLADVERANTALDLQALANWEGAPQR